MDMITSDDIWKTADLFINAGMFIATILVFLIALPQARSAKDSAEAAKDAAKSAIAANALMKEQFDIENRPYLVLTKLNFGQFKPNKPFISDWELTNLGKHPIKIIKERNYIFLAAPNESYSKKEEMIKVLNQQSFRDIEMYVAGDGNNRLGNLEPNENQITVTQEIFDNVMTGKRNMYFAYEWIYENLTNPKTKRHAICIMKVLRVTESEVVSTSLMINNFDEIK